MRRIRLLAVIIPAAAIGAALTGCTDGSTGQSAARAACTAYAKTGRHHDTTSVQAKEALRAEARSAASSAAADTWAVLRRDIDAAYVRESTLASTHNSGQLIDGNAMRAYFDADQRVQADCKSAGQDIGPLQP